MVKATLSLPKKRASTADAAPPGYAVSRGVMRERGRVQKGFPCHVDRGSVVSSALGTPLSHRSPEHAFKLAVEVNFVTG